MTKPTKRSEIKREWHLINATDQILGRLSTQLAIQLMGKNKPYFAHNLDCGDHIVVINAEKIKVSGRKENQKIYKRYSGYPGGQREQTLAEVRTKFPTRIIEKAVAGMLPDNKLKAGRMKRLHLFAGETHSYEDKFMSQAVKPVVVSVKSKATRPSKKSKIKMTSIKDKIK